MQMTELLISSSPPRGLQVSTSLKENPAEQDNYSEIPERNSSLYGMLRFCVLAVLAIATVHGASTTGNLRRLARQVETLTQGPSSQNKDRSIYARRASGITGIVSDVYEVFVGPSNFTYTKTAVVVLHPDKDSGVRGILYLSQEGNHAPVNINGTITGLTPGKHGFHIHQSGNTAEGCKSAGGHFNPFTQPHGAPGDDKRHIGDLGNIEANSEGTTEIKITDSKISLAGTTTIIGRSVVVHEKEDDLGKGGDEGSTKTGNAGGRVACGVIAIL
ncbi:unnamed protein product [Allacma fusca]|uniref:Superoxide dismutase [Cu-Zn] n=1 Tax=Allacma fusca TaxID=39272 RepID=A0A8J2LNV9_9HEXA|nr:unnamed protein product [Allacma fusca]